MNKYRGNNNAATINNTIVAAADLELLNQYTNAIADLSDIKALVYEAASLYSISNDIRDHILADVTQQYVHSVGTVDYKYMLRSIIRSM